MLLAPVPCFTTQTTPRAPSHPVTPVSFSLLLPNLTTDKAVVVLFARMCKFRPPVYLPTTLSSPVPPSNNAKDTPSRIHAGWGQFPDDNHRDKTPFRQHKEIMAIWVTKNYGSFNIWTNIHTTWIHRRSQTQKDTQCVIPCIWHSVKGNTRGTDQMSDCQRWEVLEGDLLQRTLTLGNGKPSLCW